MVRYQGNSRAFDCIRYLHGSKGASQSLIRIIISASTESRAGHRALNSRITTQESKNLTSELHGPSWVASQHIQQDSTSLQTHRIAMAEPCHAVSDVCSRSMVWKAY